MNSIALFMIIIVLTNVHSSETYSTISTYTPLYESNSAPTSSNFLFGHKLDFENSTVSLEASVDKQLENKRETHLNDASLFVVIPHDNQQSWIDVEIENEFKIPLSENSTKRNKMISHYTFGLPIKFRPTLNTFKGLTLTYTPSLSYGLYKYQTTKEGRPITRSRIAQEVKIKWMVLKRLSLQASASVYFNWDHQNKRQRDLFEQQQIIEYNVNPKFNLGVSHLNKGRLYQQYKNEFNASVTSLNSSIILFYIDLII